VASNQAKRTADSTALRAASSEVRATPYKIARSSKLAARSFLSQKLRPKHSRICPILAQIAYNSIEVIRSYEENGMTQKVIDVVGTSKESFAKAAEEAVREAAKTVRGIKWAHVDSLDMLLDGKKVLQYRATTKIYFDVEH
jgi:dodecin